MASAISVSGLHKSYGDFEAVRGIDLEVSEGEVFAFLGPNGAGKTTTVEILEGFRTATSGTVRVLGEDPASAPLAWREDIGIVLQQSEPSTELSARESVQMHAAYYQNPRGVDEVIEIVGLTDKADDRAKKMSGGQQRRLDLALALIGDPKLVFLDEPTTGFDPSARRDSWTMIENLRSLGTTVMLTTHYMDEAQQLADRIAVIARGVLVAEGTADQLAEQVKSLPIISWTATAADAPFGAPLGAGRVGLVVEADDVTATVHRLTSWATDDGVELTGLEVSRPTLEDTYLALVGHDDAEAANDTQSASGEAA